MSLEYNYENLVRIEICNLMNFCRNSNRVEKVQRSELLKQASDHFSNDQVLNKF